MLFRRIPLHLKQWKRLPAFMLFGTRHMHQRPFWMSSAPIRNYWPRNQTLCEVFCKPVSVLNIFIENFLMSRCRLSEQELVRFFNGIKTLAGDDPETYRIFQPEGATQVTTRIAEGLVATGMLRDIPPNPPFDGRFVEFPKP
jgi:hypothetical protein